MMGMRRTERGASACWCAPLHANHGDTPKPKEARLWNRAPRLRPAGLALEAKR